MSNTYVLKGFVTVQGLINNTPNTIASIGEISLWSMTYTKDRGEYKNPLYPDYKLVGISSKDSDLGDVEVHSDIANMSIEITDWARGWLSGQTLPVAKLSFITAVNNHFFGQIADLDCGDFIQQGVDILPQWLSWTMSDGTTDSIIKIWYADQAFREQFDEFEIVVIPPVDNIDDLFLAYNSAVALITSRTPKETTDLIQDAKDGSPETYIRTLTFNFVNTTNTTQFTRTNWNVLIYGIRGDSFDTIREAIIEYITLNSSYTVAQWTEIMPDLFKSTEFILVPRWDLIAIADLTLLPGIFSPTQTISQTLTFATTEIVDYPAAHVETSVETFSHPYRSILVLACGNPDNAVNKQTIKMMFPDYINVGTLSTDFNRMTTETKAFSNLMQEMLMISNTLQAFTLLPSKYRIINRAGKLYLSTNVDNVTYLMSARKNFL